MTPPSTRRRFSVSVFQCFSFSGLRSPTSGLRHPRKSSFLPAESASLATPHSPLITGRRPAAFTLIELLVVIAIIAILAGLGFAGLQGALESSKKAQARNDVQQIAAAVRAFELEYGRQPSSQTGDDQWVANNQAVMQALLGRDSSLNPRGISFLEVKNAKGNPPKGGIDSSGTFLDPWGNAYFIKLNTDYDNVVEYYGENFLSVIVGSGGPNGEVENPTGSDDIVNFK